MAAPSLSIQLRTFAESPANWQTLLDHARAADAAGIDRIVVSDHIVFGEDLDAYGDPGVGGTKGGRQPTGPDGHWLEPLTVLSVLAGLTTQVRLGTNILLAALRRPAVLAKSVATLDVLSGGRVDLGVGVGWQRAEYEACGLDFDARGSLLDDTLDVCRTLWTEPVANHASPALSFSGIHAMPKPVQHGGVPLWVSGTINPRSMRRLARYGAGWIPWGDDAVDVTNAIARMRAAVSSYDRDPVDIGVVGTLPVVRTDGEIDLDATMRATPSLVEAGVTDFRAHIAIPDDLDAATRLLSNLVTSFRTATN